MKNQAIMYGIVGLVIGVLLTGFVMSSQNKQAPAQTNTMMTNEASSVRSGSSMSMEDMMTGLKGKTGDDFDKTFISEMITHHQGAIDMANQAKLNAKHDELKKLADDIISAQTSEIEMMKQWQKDWGYTQ